MTSKPDGHKVSENGPLHTDAMTSQQGLNLLRQIQRSLRAIHHG
jgi:hypothetical protein